MSDGEFVKLARVEDVPAGTCIGVEHAGAPIAICNVDGTLHAVEDFCTHAGAKISEGKLEGTCLTCPWHDAVFDVTTGEPAGGPAFSAVEVLEVRVQGRDVFVRVPPR